MPTINLKPVNSRIPNRAIEAGVANCDYDNAKKIYNTRMWSSLRKSAIMEHPICQQCGKGISQDVHHIIPIPRYGDILAAKTIGFDPTNLIALCKKCHSEHHKRNNSDGN